MEPAQVVLFLVIKRSISMVLIVVLLLIAIALPLVVAS